MKIKPLEDGGMEVYYNIADGWNVYAKSKKWRWDVLRGMTYFLRTWYSDKEIKAQIDLHAKEDRED